MCGRFTLRTPLSILAQQFLFDLSGDGHTGTLSAAWRPRYNIAPTQDVVAVRTAGTSDEPTRELAWFRWGLIPSWAKDEKIAYSTINARADTVATKPAFRSAFRKRRCLILVDGYYEWKPVGKLKQPYFFHFSDERPFAVAGLWESWQPVANSAAERLETCTLITTDANSTVAPIHNRMPVILSANDAEVWLDPRNESAESLQHLLQPYPETELVIDAVNPYVNNARHEGPECLQV